MLNTQNQTTLENIKISDFENEVRSGLTADPKYLSSRFIYNKKGDALFQKIMAMPSYYLTRSEMEIFQNQKSEIAACFDADKSGFDLVELGAGDGRKTQVLLEELINSNYNFTYQPIDISQNALTELTATLRNEIPQLEVVPKQGEYFEVLSDLKITTSRKRVVMFLGSNIGNLLHPRAIEFLQGLAGTMRTQDRVFIGFDQKKEPQQILDAYNDKEGITAAFNMNLLERINDELGGNFNTNQFKHWEVYDPETGTAKSYLVSLKKQMVTIDKLAMQINFEAWETIHTEISQKYDDKTVAWLARESGLEICTTFIDSNAYYKNYIFKKV